MLKKSGLGGFPCFTPSIISKASDMASPSLTCAVVFEYIFLNKLNIFPFIPYDSIFARSPFLQTVSKAFEKSWNRNASLSFSLNCLSINVFNTKQLFDVLILGLNPIRWGWNKFKFSKHVVNFFKILLLKNFAKQEDSEIPGGGRATP